MSSSAYIDTVFAAWSQPDRWDVGDVDGGAFAGSEQAFKESGELVAKQRSGALPGIDANRINAVTRMRGWQNGQLRLTTDDEEEQPDVARTLNDGQRALLRGIEIDLTIKPGAPGYTPTSGARPRHVRRGKAGAHS